MQLGSIVIFGQVMVRRIGGLHDAELQRRWRRSRRPLDPLPVSSCDGVQSRVMYAATLLNRKSSKVRETMGRPGTATRQG
jgi:hypothetical protein